MPWSVTIKTGLKDVVLPNGLRYQAGDIVVLSDDQIQLISKTAIANLFTAAPTAVSATLPAGAS